MIYFKLDSLLKQFNYSRNKFALLTGVRPNTINDICNGNTKRLEIDTLESIMYALNEISESPVNIEDFLQYKKEETH